MGVGFSIAAWSVAAAGELDGGRFLRGRNPGSGAGMTDWAAFRLFSCQPPMPVATGTPRDEKWAPGSRLPHGPWQRPGNWMGDGSCGAGIPARGPE